MHRRDSKQFDPSNRYLEVRMNINTPSYTTQPMAELNTLRVMRREAPSKNPPMRRC